MKNAMSNGNEAQSSTVDRLGDRWPVFAIQQQPWVRSLLYLTYMLLLLFPFFPFMRLQFQSQYYSTPSHNYTKRK
jgi:hypothetical protein